MIRLVIALSLAAVGCSATAPPPPINVAVAPTTKRFVLEPDAMAFVYDDDDGAEKPVAPLGAKLGAHARLLVRFPHPGVPGTVERAWLVLDRAQGAQAGPGSVTLRADAIVEPWSIPGGAGTLWSMPPKSEAISGAITMIEARGASPIRIDVTAWAQKLAKKGPRPWGLRLEGSGEGFGLPVATGAGNGRPPRLEVFVQ